MSNNHKLLPQCQLDFSGLYYIMVSGRLYADKNLTPIDVYVGVWISAYMVEDGWCYASDEQLAKESRRSVAAVRKSVAKLEANGNARISYREHPSGHAPGVKLRAIKILSNSRFLDGVE